MKNKKILAVLATAGVALSLAACGGGELEPKAADTSSEAAKSEAPASTTAPAPSAEPKAPAEPAGTVSDPFPAGTVLTSSDGTVSFAVNSVDWAASPVVAAENQFNEPAPEGFTYVLANVTVTNISSEEAIAPWLNFYFSFVADDGRSFDTAMAVVPASLNDVGDLYPGGVGTGNTVFLLPNDAISGGKWSVSYNWANPVFVSAH